MWSAGLKQGGQAQVRKLHVLVSFAPASVLILKSLWHVYQSLFGISEQTV